MKLRVGTYNIHKGVTALRKKPRIHALKQALMQLDIDVLFLQEVQGRNDLNAIRYAQLWPAQGQHEFLAGDSHHAVYGMNAIYHHGHHGNALLSRFAIGTAYNLDISDHAYEARGILHCIVKAHDVDVYCYVVHLGLFAGSRYRQIMALIDAVDASTPRDAPLIIAGDFNDWSNQLSAYLRIRLGVLEVFEQYSIAKLAALRPARTFPARLPCLRLDRIYLRGFEIESAEVLGGKLWASLSDHAPLISTLRLK